MVFFLVLLFEGSHVLTDTRHNRHTTHVRCLKTTVKRIEKEFHTRFESSDISDFHLRYPDFQLRFTHPLQQEAHSPAVMKASRLIAGQLGKPRVDSGSATPDAGESVGGRPGELCRLRDRLSPGSL